MFLYKVTQQADRRRLLSILRYHRPNSIYHDWEVASLHQRVMAIYKCSLIGPFFNIEWTTCNWSTRNSRHSYQADGSTSPALNDGWRGGWDLIQKQLEQQRIESRLREKLLKRRIKQLKQEFGLRRETLEQKSAKLLENPRKVRSPSSSFLDGVSMSPTVNSRSFLTDAAPLGTAVGEHSSNYSAVHGSIRSGKSLSRGERTSIGKRSQSSAKTGGSKSSCSSISKSSGEDNKKTRCRNSGYSSGKSSSGKTCGSTSGHCRDRARPTIQAGAEQKRQPFHLASVFAAQANHESPVDDGLQLGTAASAASANLPELFAGIHRNAGSRKRKVGAASLVTAFPQHKRSPALASGLALGIRAVRAHLPRSLAAAAAFGKGDANPSVCAASQDLHSGDGCAVETLTEVQQDDMETKTTNTIDTCVFCKRVGDGPSGKILFQAVAGKKMAMHHECLQWSPRAYEEGGIWMNVTAEVFRGRQLSCVGCGKTGATLGCEVCNRSYHVPCAHVAACRFDETAFTIRCPKHTLHAMVAFYVSFLYSMYYTHRCFLLLFRTTPTYVGCVRMVGLWCAAMAVAAVLSTWAASVCMRCRVQIFGSVGPVVAEARRLAVQVA